MQCAFFGCCVSARAGGRLGAHVRYGARAGRGMTARVSYVWGGRGGRLRGYKAGARLCGRAALGRTLPSEQCVAGPLGLILAHGAGLSGCKIAFPTSSKQMQPGHRRTQHCSSTKLAGCEGAAAVSRPDHCAVRARELPMSLVTRETRKR